MSESFLSSQSHLKIFSSRVRASHHLVESSQRESQELSTHFESLVCKLESMPSQMKFHILSMTFLCYEMGAQHAMNWLTIR